MEEKLAASEARGSAPGRQIQGLLDVFQQRATSKKPTQPAEESEGNHALKDRESEENWRRNLFTSPKKKLQERWGQVSPSVRQTLTRYSPRKLRELFVEEQAAAENVPVMEDCASASHGGSQMLEERQSRYKQIAAFYLDEATPDESPATSSQHKSYLTENDPLTSPVKSWNKSLKHVLKEAEVPVPYESNEPVEFLENDPWREDFSATNNDELSFAEPVLDYSIIENPCHIPDDHELIPTEDDVLLTEAETQESCITSSRTMPDDTIAHEAAQKTGEQIEDTYTIENNNQASEKVLNILEPFVQAQTEPKITSVRELVLKLCNQEVESKKTDLHNEPKEDDIKSEELLEDPEIVALSKHNLAAHLNEEKSKSLAENSVQVKEAKIWSECGESEISSDIHREGSSCSNEQTDSADYVVVPGAMAVVTPHIVLQGPDMTGAVRRPMSLHPPPLDPDGVLKRKSPVTVQEWVDHLPVKATAPEGRAEEPMESAAMLRCQTASRLSREASVQSSSSLDSLLDSRRPDPVEVLLNLGFGGVPGIDLDNCRIPKRFLVPSKCKGGDWNEFLQRELLQVQNFECASLGFRGLSGPSHLRPSAIVANIMEKLRERTTPRPPPKRFTSVARRILSETSVLSKLSHPRPPSSTTSVLTPDNRKFLESQGKVSPEVPRRRIIFGQKSFAIGKDGELMEEVTLPQKESEVSVSMGSWSAGSALSADESDSEDGKSELAPSPMELLRMRRSSLQRQRNVEEGEGEGDDGPAIPCRFLPVPEDGDGDDLRDALAAEIQTLSRKIRSAPPEELAAILEPIKELRVKLNEL